MDEKILKESLPFFSELQDEDKQSLSYSSYTQKLLSGEILMNAELGWICNSIIYVLSGRLKCMIRNDKNESCILYYLEKGTYCVLSAAQVLYNIEIPLEIIVDSAEAEVLKIPIHTYLSVNQKYPFVARFTRHQFTDRFTDIAFILGEKVFKTSRQVLAGFLYERFNQEDGPLCITEFSISSSIAVSRSVIAKYLKEMEENGIIKHERGFIELLDSEALMRSL